MDDNLVVCTASLLHDIGKIAQRAGIHGSHSEAGIAFIDKFASLFPPDGLSTLREAIGFHHDSSTQSSITKTIRLADKLASSELEEGFHCPERTPAETPLLPIMARIEFREQKPESWARWGFRPLELRLNESHIFPEIDVRVSAKDYETLQANFEKELQRLGTISDYFGFISLLAILRKYTSLIPSSTPTEADEEYRTMPDTSLFDHLKVSCAIAGCLMRLDSSRREELCQSNDSDQKISVARILRADFSGIQNYIYRIARAESTAEFRNTAKRLRGRSFYLTLLSEVISEWITRDLGLLPPNILFSGGGRFDLLVGADNGTEQRLDDINAQLQNWILNEFHGDLGIQLAWVDLYPKDFQDLQRASELLEENLAHEKQTKCQSFIKTTEFFVQTKPLYHVCNFCHLTPLPSLEDEPCPSCSLQRKIGGKLPSTDYLVCVYPNKDGSQSAEIGVELRLSNLFDVTVALVTKEELNRVLLNSGQLAERIVAYRLNDTSLFGDDYPPNVAFGFKFLGNTSPTSRCNLAPNPVDCMKDPLREGEVLDFDEIAFMSNGAKLLGVLRADVDYLGLAFGLGVNPRSLTRIATLSGFLDLFFAGWINEICDRAASKWNDDPTNDNTLKGKVNGLFYIVYSGGDDLFILGPWDALLDLAQTIHAQFQRFTCQNDNLTLSAGLLLVKPHFPIQRFALLSGEMLERAKSVGDRQDFPGLNRKDRITVFGDSVPWINSDNAFESLIDFGKKLAKQVEDKKLRKSFIYSLLRLHDQHFSEEGNQDLMWIPYLHYGVVRNISQETLADAELNLLENTFKFMSHIRIPASYVSYKTRR
jgi:CRISPR-associated protein Csm1